MFFPPVFVCAEQPKRSEKLFGFFFQKNLSQEFHYIVVLLGGQSTYIGMPIDWDNLFL